MIRILQGDCLIELPKLAATGERFHACVCDPPYGLEFMGKEWDAPWKADAVGIEKDATYVEDARRKLTKDAGMFAEFAA